MKADGTPTVAPSVWPGVEFQGRVCKTHSQSGIFQTVLHDLYMMFRKCRGTWAGDHGSVTARAPEKQTPELQEVPLPGTEGLWPCCWLETWGLGLRASLCLQAQVRVGVLRPAHLCPQRGR